MVCAVIFRGDSRFVVPTGDLPYESAAPVSQVNGTGAFSVRQLDASAGYRPAFSLAWKNMRAENGRLAFFKTPLHKTVTIDGLHVKFYQHSSEDAAARLSDRDGRRQRRLLVGDGEAAARDMFVEAIDVLAREFRTKTQGMAMDSLLPADISSATKVIINDLDYSLFCRDQLELGIKCHNAVASASESEIVLRGGVVIQADGGKLMSNCVLWDMEKGQFSVPGTYVMDRDGVPVRGSGLRCDHHLRPFTAREVYNKKGAEQWVKGSSF
jgi:hypothetical protein